MLHVQIPATRGTLLIRFQPHRLFARRHDRLRSEDACAATIRHKKTRPNTKTVGDCCQSLGGYFFWKERSAGHPARSRNPLTEHRILDWVPFEEARRGMPIDN